jgi:hypothetical protein
MPRLSRSIPVMALALVSVLLAVPFAKTAASAAAPLPGSPTPPPPLPSVALSLPATATPASGGNHSVSLSASDTGAVTFSEDQLTLPAASYGGVIDILPRALNFSYTKGGQITDPLRPGDQKSATTAATGRIPFQRFDIASSTPHDSALVWRGNADPARLVRLWAWNITTTAWDVVAAGRGVADGQLSLRGDAQTAYFDSGVVHLLVTGEDPFADDLAKPVDNAFADPSAYDFSIAHFSDTQYLTEGAVERNTATERAVWRKAYAEIPQWIVANAAARKIVYTAHTGDVIEDWLNTSYLDEAAAKTNARNQFAVASANQKILDDAGLVNAVLPGNHDSRTGTETGASALFNDYFGPSRYNQLESGTQWQDENASYHPWKSGDNSNHYDLFTAGGLDFVAVHLGYGVRPDEIAWANRVLTRYADRNAILFTHAFNKASYAADGREYDYSNDGARLEEQVVATHSNVALILSGHEHGVSIAVKKNLGKTGNNVTELLADYQFYQANASEVGLAGVDGHQGNDQLRFGASFLQLLQFNVARGEINIDTFSPFLNNFNASEYDNQHRYNGSEDDTTVPVQLSSRKTSFSTDTVALSTPTGTTIGVATGSTAGAATLTWAGLDAGQVRGWQARAAGKLIGYGLFTVPSRVSDSGAPAIALPSATVVLGKAFDSSAGVATSGSLLTVLGGLDSTQVGEHQLGYLVSDAAGNQTVGLRQVSVTKPDAAEVPDQAHPQISVLLPSTRQGVATTASVTVKAGGFLVGGGQITLTLDGQQLTTATLNEGRVQLPLPAELKPGGHVLQTSYSGNESTEAARIESTFTVAARVQR